MQLDYPTNSSGFHDSICFQVMHIPMVSPKIPKGKWIKWAPPPFGILKLNTDGSSRNGMAAGGGIIRDYKGSALVAFSTFYGPGTNTFAEARAPLFGLMLCYRLGYSKVAVESEKKSFLIASVEALDSPLYDQIFQNFLTSFHVHLSYLQGRESKCRHFSYPWPLPSGTF